MRPAGETDKDAAWICFDDWFGNAYWNGKEAARLAGLALVAQKLMTTLHLRAPSPRCEVY